MSSATLSAPYGAVIMAQSGFAHDLARLLTLQDASTRTVLLGTGLLGLAAGVVGALAVLRKRALVSDAVSHAALPGIALAYLTVGGKNFAYFMIGAMLTGLLAAMTISFVRTLTRVKEDAVTALVIGSFFGCGVALSSYVQNRGSGDRAGLDTFIYGKAASMVHADALTIAVVAAACLAVVAVLFKELRLLCFDRSFAAAQGWPVHRLDLLLMSLVCLCTVAGLPAVGVVLMVALLVTPAAAARFWSDRFTTVVVLSGVFGAVSGVLGTALSAVLPTTAESLSRGWPTGPVIVLVASLIFACSVLLAPRRGVIPAFLRRAAARADGREPSGRGAGA